MKRILKWIGATILFALILAFLVGFIAYWRSSNDCDRKAGAPANPMKAIVHCEYGGPEVLTLTDVEKPVPTDNQVLVKVRAASLNPLDLTIRGPWLVRPLLGMRKPKDTRLGVDYAGTVEAVGKNVTQCKPGDEVFGGKNGALAEYVCVLADRAVTLKSANVTFEQAASVPVAAITALQGLRDKGKIKPGQKVLVNGASGGVGTFAVQIAKSFGLAFHSDAFVEIQSLRDGVSLRGRMSADLLEFPDVLAHFMVGAHHRPDSRDLVLSHIQHARADRRDVDWGART